MSLRQKTILTVSLGVFLLMLTVYLLFSGRTMQAALRLEQTDLERNLTRAKNAIIAELRQLETTTLDWAIFDETYNYLIDQNPLYAERNLTQNLGILDLEFFILEKRDKIALTRQRVDINRYQPSFEALGMFINPSRWFWRETRQSLQRMQSFPVQSGMVGRDGFIYFVTNAAVQSSSQKSPSVGSLTMVKVLDIPALARLSELTLMNIRVVQKSSLDFSPPEQAAIDRLFSGERMVTIANSRNLIGGYSLLSEIKDQQVLLLEVSTERSTYLAAQEFLNQLAWSLALIGVLVTAMMIGLLEVGVLSRLMGLHKELGQIANSGDISHRLTVRGVDELGKLTQQINSSLSRVEEIQVRSVQLQAKLERLRSTELAASLEETRLELFERLARIAEFRDNETGLHTSRVGEISYSLAMELNLPADECERLRYASRLHDIGKIAIPDSILFKPSGLDTQEWLLMQTHATLGGQMLEGSGSPLLEMARLIATTHHERWNGSGYPSGLHGEEIPILGRIVGVADTLDALTSNRSYKPAWTFQDALDEITAHSGQLFDPKVVQALLRISPKLSPNHSHETIT